MTYLGRIDQLSVAQQRRNALATIVPSECFEGQPFGVLESMAVGTPVIASNLGGLAEIVEHGKTGVLVPPGDPTTLAKAMEALWDDPASAAAMGRRGWEYARTHFAPDRQTARIVALYESATASRNTSQRSGRHGRGI